MAAASSAATGSLRSGRTVSASSTLGKPIVKVVPTPTSDCTSMKPESGSADYGFFEHPPIHRRLRRQTHESQHGGSDVENAGTAELVSDGNGVTGTIVGIPFPIPKDGQEVIWNHLLRYRGVGVTRSIAQATPQRNGAYSLVTFADDISDDAHDLVIALDKALAASIPVGVTETLPVLVNLLVSFDPVITDHFAVEAHVRQ